MKHPRLSYVACCTLLAIGTSTVAVTPSHAYAAPQAAEATAATFEINLPAQATSSALLQLAEQTNSQIIFAPDLARNKSSDALQGNFSVAQALTQLLDGTGLSFEQQDQRTFVITSASSSRMQDNFRAQLGNAEGEKGSNVERIQVVGSNIRGARAAGNLPVTILDSEAIENTGAATGDELLRSIPQVGDISFNNERVIGGVNDARGDVASINLRGIGTGNTLTLLNGRRLVLHPGTQTENFVPVTTVNSNTLPVAGLRRLEVLRDGAAAIYGTDAVAGVINYVLKDDIESTNFRVNYGASDGTSFDQLTASGSTGVSFNDDKSHLTLSLAYYTRDELPASERDYSASEDRRFHPDVPAEFQGDTQLDNRSLTSPWGIFDTSSYGRIHLRPDSMGACEVHDFGDGVCADSGSLPRDMRYDRAVVDESMTSAVDRVNLYSHFTHSFSDDLEFFAEALYYEATSKRRREQNHNLSAQRFTISADAAYNPFGEDIKLRNLRPVDFGGRRIEVEDTSYRLLAGLRGYLDMWDWESAVLYSRADTLDTAYNRIRTSALQAAINNSDPSQAYNPFIGGNPEHVNYGPGARNPEAILAGIRTDVTRESKSELALWDFKISNPAITTWYAGDIGLAAGVEYRYEGYADDRDALLDGSQPFYDQVTGRLLSDSDVLGSSSTPDASGSRNVLSAYAELLVPLHDTVDMQVAVRHERFNDVGNVTKPKLALSWAPTDWVQLRAAYAEGFRAPNLPQVVEQGISRSNTRTDPILDQSYGIEERRGGNVNLQPEDSETLSYGFALAPIDGLLITVDWWDIEQDGVVGILNSQTHLLYDSLLRSQGSQNDAVIRDDDLEVIYVENQYNNLDIRTIKGIDTSINYRYDTDDFGRFSFTLNAAHLKEFVQEPDPISALVLAAQAEGNPAVPIDLPVYGAGDLLRMSGNPEWRGFAGIDWDYDNWGAGVRYNYVSDFLETSVGTSEGVNMVIPSWSTVDLYADYRFRDGALDGTRLRFGVRNIGDKEPPIADESFGYFSSVHSNRGRYIYGTWSWTF
ncbi:TonB-dependent receptor [Pseudidiomarina sediminum]|uniref:TonB-dependent receptor n=2 Tax=Pseudidiomarina sediminum TaxID=431675 RepID=A0A432Z987_9GAMM|nr:TonB-dependent receptor [Pseudidiomarina sediminum]RUO74483.1 TonB-dependent receptor [Pseudidiomarina sediminum]